jgi:hypothetical protein
MSIHVDHGGSLRLAEIAYLMKTERLALAEKGEFHANICTRSHAVPDAQLVDPDYRLGSLR